MQDTKDKGKVTIRVLDGELFRTAYVLKQAILVVLFIELWIPGGLAIALLYKGTSLVLLGYCLMLILVLGASWEFVSGLSGAERKLWSMWVIWLVIAISLAVRAVAYFKYREYLTKVDLHPLFSAVIFVQEQLWAVLMYKLVWCVINVEIVLFVLFRLHLRLKGSSFIGLIHKFQIARYNYGVVNCSITESLKELLKMVILGMYLALLVVLVLSSGQVWTLGVWLSILTMYSALYNLGYNRTRLCIPMIKTHHLMLSKLYVLIITFHYVLVNVVTWGWGAIKSSPILKYDAKVFSLMVNVACIGYILLNLILVTRQTSGVSGKKLTH